MKECSQEELEYVLGKRWIREGVFTFNKAIINFAYNIVRDEIYLVDEASETHFGYEVDEQGNIPSFIFNSRIYTLSRIIFQKNVTPIKQRLTTTTAIFEVVGENEDLRYWKRTEAALAHLAFSIMEEFVGEDLTDLEEGSHILSEDHIVEPDSAFSVLNTQE